MMAIEFVQIVQILAEFNLEICSAKGSFPMQSEWGRIFDFFSETA
jgi:hypothetical protein